MLISKILLRKFVHEVTIDSVIIIQIRSKAPCAKWEVLKNEKCTWSLSQKKNHLLNVSLKRKTDHISIIIQRVTIEKRARAVGIPRQGAGMRQVSHFFENVTNPGLLPINVAVYDKPN